MSDQLKNTESLRLYNKEFVEKADAAISQAYERRAKMLKDIHVLDMSIADIEQARRSAMTSSILCLADDGDRDYDFNAQTHGEVLEMVTETIEATDDPIPDPVTDAEDEPTPAGQTLAESLTAVSIPIGNQHE